MYIYIYGCREQSWLMKYHVGPTFGLCFASHLSGKSFRGFTQNTIEAYKTVRLPCIWLVVWNMFLVQKYWEIHHLN